MSDAVMIFFFFFFFLKFSLRELRVRELPVICLGRRSSEKQTDPLRDKCRRLLIPMSIGKSSCFDTAQQIILSRSLGKKTMRPEVDLSVFIVNTQQASQEHTRHPSSVRKYHSKNATCTRH